MRRQWSLADDAYLKRWAGRRPLTHLAAHLSRTGVPVTANAVRHRLRALKLAGATPQGWARLSEAGALRAQLREQALAAGVLKKAWDNDPRAPALVPEEWLEAQLEERLARGEAEALARIEGWWTVGDVAARLGVHRSYVYTCCRPGAERFLLGQLFKNVERRTGPMGRWYFEPAAARRAVARYQVRRVKRKKAILSREAA